MKVVIILQLVSVSNQHRKLILCYLSVISQQNWGGNKEMAHGKIRKVLSNDNHGKKTSKKNSISSPRAFHWLQVINK